MPVLKQILMTAALDTASGVDPDPADNAILSFDATIDFETDELDRKRDKSHLGASPKTIVGERAKITFDFDLMGSAIVGDPSPLDPIFLCGAMTGVNVPAVVGPPAVTERYRYTPITAGQFQGRIWFYWGDGSADDLLFVVDKAKCDLSLTIKSKDVWKGKATFTGVVEALPTEEGPPTGLVLTGFQKSVVATTEKAEAKVNDISVRCYQMDFNLSNSVSVVEDFKMRKTRIDERDPNFVLYVVKEAFSVVDFWAIAKAQAEDNTVRVTLDDGAARTMELYIPTSQLLYPKLTEYEKQPAYEIRGIALPSGDGNNEFRLDCA